GPGRVDVVGLGARRRRVGDDELLVVEDVRIVVACNNAEWRIAVGLEATGRIRRVVEGSADPGVRLRDDERARVRADIEEDTAYVGVPLGVEGRRRVAARVGRVSVRHNELVEGRDLVAPGL